MLPSAMLLSLIKNNAEITEQKQTAKKTAAKKTAAKKPADEKEAE